jgi:dihydrofolate reductase
VRKLVYYIGLSIDGFIAGPNDEVDFYPGSDEYMRWMTTEYPETLPTHVRRHLGIDAAPNRHFDTLVMGRRTYDPALKLGITSPYAHLRQYVFSRTLQPRDPNVTLVNGDVVETVRALKREESALDIYLAGGGELAGQLLDELDRLVVKLYPVVAGAGRTAFGSRFSPTNFNLDNVQTFPGGNAVLSYSRVR